MNIKTIAAAAWSKISLGINGRTPSCLNVTAPAQLPGSSSCW